MSVRVDPAAFDASAHGADSGVFIGCGGGGGPPRRSFPPPPPAAAGPRGEGLRPGATLVLPESRRARHSGVALVACRGTLGSVFPRLDDAGAGSGCN